MVIAARTPGPPNRSHARRQLTLFGAICAAVVIADQVGKALAWRRDDGAMINDGGNYFLGETIRGWFANPVGGPLADALGWLVLAYVTWRLTRTTRSRLVLAGYALIIAGVASNLADRVGLHRVTAPGSRRGVVDFIPSGGTSRCNVADVAILAGALLLAIAYARRATGGRRVSRSDGAKS